MKNVSRLFRACCRQIDLIARYSYDEFALILPETDDPGITVVTGRIQDRIQSLNSEISHRGSQLKLEPIFGWASYPNSATSKQLLLSRANESLLKSRA